MAAPLGLAYLDYILAGDRVPVAEMVGQLRDETIPGQFESKEDYLLFAESILEQEEVLVENERSEAEMLDSLIAGMFDRHGIAPEAIDMIIMTKEGAGDTRNNMPKYLQYRHGMRNAAVLNVTGNHCANMAIAWNIANGMPHTVNRVLIVNAFRAKEMDERVIGSYGILSDGAGLMLLSREPGLCSLVDSVSLSNGMLYKVDMNKDHSLLHLKYTVESIGRLLTRNVPASDAIRMIVPQNANVLLITNAVMESQLNIGDIFTDNIGRCGHIDSVDFIVNLKDVLAGGRLAENDHLLMLNTGWAGSYVSTLLKVHKTLNN